MNLMAFFLAFGGFAALSLAMERHYEDAFDRTLSRTHQRILRALGAGALGLSLWSCALADGWSYGSIQWIGLLTAAGLLLIWILTYAARLAWGLGGAAAGAALLLAAFG
ncbi:DUF3325 domain-containing protein [Bordetella trematum]|uniref:DUF3325 domain-containing protein n=1 Tax=Bordetella trematum TaxID=123899 RepID=UPI00052EFE76|nr:DUF3325 domain-containing protein [Bordetella trematum]